jgi:hypothetical protein
MSPPLWMLLLSSTLAATVVSTTSPTAALLKSRTAVPWGCSGQSCDNPGDSGCHPVVGGIT